LPSPIDGQTPCAKYSIARAGDTLLVSLRGEASNRRDCIGIYSLLSAAIQLAIRDSIPSAIVFDLSAVTYEWGDGMASVIGSWGLPIAVVASAKNEAALHGLIESELFTRPEEILCRSLGIALVSAKLLDG
jgi:hypothetical protein